MPASFIEETWVNWLPKAVAKPFYRDQLTAHIAELERQISTLSREIERQSGGLLDQEMQLWISDNVSSTCWRPHNSGHQSFPGTTTTDAKRSRWLCRSANHTSSLNAQNDHKAHHSRSV